MEIIPKLKEEKNERRRQYKQALKPGILEGKKAAEVPGALASALKNNIENSLVGNITDIE